MRWQVKGQNFKTRMTSLGPHSCLHTHSVLPSGASCKPAHLSAKRTESHFTPERAECLLFPSTLIFKTANREQQLALHHSYVIYQQAHMVPTHLNATCCQLNRGFYSIVKLFLPGNFWTTFLVILSVFQEKLSYFLQHMNPGQLSASWQ